MRWDTDRDIAVVVLSCDSKNGFVKGFRSVNLSGPPLF